MDVALDGDAVDPVFEQLIRNLAPGQRPVLRIGGDSTDWTRVDELAAAVAVLGFGLPGFPTGC